MNPTEEASSYFTIPYVPHISESFKNLTKDLDVKISYFSLNKMRNYIKTHKDVRPKTTHSNVVYKINCNNCDASYVAKQVDNYILEYRNISTTSEGTQQAAQ